MGKFLEEEEEEEEEGAFHFSFLVRRHAICCTPPPFSFLQKEKEVYFHARLRKHDFPHIFFLSPFFSILWPIVARARMYYIVLYPTGLKVSIFIFTDSSPSPIFAYVVDLFLLPTFSQIAWRYKKILFFY